MTSSLGLKAARFAIVLAFFALWEILSRTGMVNPRLLPSASDTIVTLFDLLQRAKIQSDLAVTALEVIIAFILLPARITRLLCWRGCQVCTQSVLGWGFGAEE